MRHISILMDVNKQNYRFWGVLIEHRLNMHDFWFQHDGTTAHTARENSLFWAFNFTVWRLFMATAVAWFITSPDSFLWGYLKGKVYLNKPNTLQEIKNNIIEEISLINPAVLESVNENTAKRTRICFNNDGKHFKNIIFKK